MSIVINCIADATFKNAKKYKKPSGKTQLLSAEDRAAKC